MPLMAPWPPMVIGMEAWGGAHYGARRFREPGHPVTLMAPQFVKPYVQSNRHDPVDAAAMAAAVRRPTMRCVPLKGIAQQDLQSLPRARERVVTARPAFVNDIRGWLGEDGLVLPPSVAQCRQTFLPPLEAARAQCPA
jgi:transposase